MRWRRGEISGHDLAREPGLGEQRDHRLDEMPLPVQPAQPLIGAKRLRDRPGPSHSVDSPTAAPPLKRVKVSEIDIQTTETIETLEKKERDQNKLCAKLQEYRTISRERDEWKKKFEDLQIAYKEEEIKHLKELYMARVSQVSPEVLATMNSRKHPGTHVTGRAQRNCAHREGPSLLSRHHGLLPTQETRYQTPRILISLLSFKSHSIRWLEQQWMRSTEPLGRHWVRAIPSQHLDHSSSSSERAPRTVVLTGTVHDGTIQKSRVVDIRKNLTVRNHFLQVATEHPRACLNGMSWNPAISNQAIPSGSRHLVKGTV